MEGRRRREGGEGGRERIGGRRWEGEGRREGGRKRREEDVGRRSEEATGWIRERRERGESREEIGGRQEEGGGKSCNMFKLLNLKRKCFVSPRARFYGTEGRSPSKAARSAAPSEGGAKRRSARPTDVAPPL